MLKEITSFLFLFLIFYLLSPTASAKSLNNTAAKEVKPELLILDHIGRLRENGKELLEGIRKGGFKGKLLLKRIRKHFRLSYTHSLIPDLITGNRQS